MGLVGRAGKGAAAVESSDTSGWINPDCLVDECEDSTCALCLGILAKPVTACPEGHSFCKSCLTQWLCSKRQCPTCRAKISRETRLVPNRVAENMISKLLVRCGAGHDEWESATARDVLQILEPEQTAKRARLSWTCSEGLGTAQNGMQQTPVLDKSQLASENRDGREEKDAGCKWRGTVGELLAHRETCGWVPVPCLNRGCNAEPLRRDLAQHESICGRRMVACQHCALAMECRAVASHEGDCDEAPATCPNSGCSFFARRSALRDHRQCCPCETVACCCPGCNSSFRRRDVDAHVQSRHVQGGSVGLLLQALTQSPPVHVHLDYL